VDLIKIKNHLDKLCKLGLENNKPTVFTIGSTSKSEEIDFYLTPIRHFKDFVVAGIVVYCSETATQASLMADGLVDYVFVDAEKKIPDFKRTRETVNIELDVKSVVTESVCISYKANDISVDAADMIISEYYRKDPVGLGRKKVALIGLGNIGFKLALKLVERGAMVYCYRRTEELLEQLVKTINDVKPKFTAAKAFKANSILEACTNADVILGCTDGAGVIGSKELISINLNAVIMDIGKGSIKNDGSEFLLKKSIPEFRLSVEHALEGFIFSSLSLEKHFKKIGRGTINGIELISGGLSARKGEVIVDDFRNPSFIYGIGNGNGDFMQVEDGFLKKIEKTLLI